MKLLLIACFVGSSLFIPSAQAIFSDALSLCKSAVAISAPVDTAEDVLAICQVPPGALAQNGVLKIKSAWTITNNANAKNIRTRYSGIAGTVLHNSNVASLANGVFDGIISSRGAANSQFSVFVGFFSATVLTPPSVATAVDTTLPTTIVITCQKGTGTDTCTLESYLVELIGGGT